MKTYTICLALAGVLICPFASAQWVQTNGPSGGQVFSLAVSGINLFAGTETGVFRSTDNGANWIAANTGLTKSAVNALAVGGPTLIAGMSGGGVFFSTNSGDNWTYSGLPIAHVYSLVVRGVIVYAGAGAVAATMGVFRATNNLTTWTQVNNGLADTNVGVVAVSGMNLFAGTYHGGVFRSTNSGDNWTSTGLSGGDILALAVNGTKLFAAQIDNGVFVSTNSGDNWTYSGLATADIFAFATSGTNLFAGAGGGGISLGLFLSTDSGTTWNLVNAGLATWNIRALVANGTYLFAGTESGVWRRPLSELITEVEGGRPTPKFFILGQNYPNPFNPVTTIKYELPKSSVVSLAVFDILGREVSVLVNERRDAGVYEVRFDGSNLASGMYFYRLQAGDYVATKRFLLVK